MYNVYLNHTFKKFNNFKVEEKLITLIVIWIVTNIW